MTEINNPKLSIAQVNDLQTISNAPQRILAIGQKTAAGTANALELYTELPNDSEYETQFGANSVLSSIIRAVKRDNKQTRLDVIALDDNGAGVAADSDITVTGTATEAGTIKVIAGSEKNHAYSVAIAVGDTATVVGDAIEAAINADTRCPVTASNLAGVITVTAVNKGELGNDIGLAIVGSVAGLTFSVPAMANGAGDPDLSTVLALIGNSRYQGIIWPYTSDLDTIKDFLDARFNVNGKPLDGVAVTCKRGSYAALTAELDALNSPSLVYFVDKTESETQWAGPAQMELSPVKAATFAAIRGLRGTEGAALGQYVIAAGSPLDLFGGPALASKPYFSTPAPYLPLIKVGRGWSSTEIDAINAKGGSVIGVNPAGNSVIFGEVVTTYKTDSAGNPDVTWTKLNYVDSASNVREYQYVNMLARFGSSRLARKVLEAGRGVVDTGTIKSYALKLYQDLSGPDFVLVEGGDDATDFYLDNLDVTLDLANGKVTMTNKIRLVTQLRSLTVTNTITF